MKTSRFLAALFLVGACSWIGIMSVSTAAHAAASNSQGGGHAAVQRPISDFVNAQGSTNIFIPPLPDFVGWTDNPPNGCNSTAFASVDYAGLAARWLADNGGPSVGTQVSGSVTERPLPDGRADVKVILHTTNALSWVIPFPVNDIATDPTIFGDRATTLLANPSLQPALSESHLQVSFTNTAMGAPLPDVVAFLLGTVQPGQSLEMLSFRSSGTGPLHASFGVPEGTPGRLTITQTGLLGHTFKGCVGDAFPAEIINLGVVGGSGLTNGTGAVTGMRQASTLQAQPATPGTPAAPIPVRHNWGQLKLLYR